MSPTPFTSGALVSGGILLDLLRTPSTLLQILHLYIERSTQYTRLLRSIGSTMTLQRANQSRSSVSEFGKSRLIARAFPSIKTIHGEESSQASSSSHFDPTKMTDPTGISMSESGDAILKSFPIATSFHRRIRLLYHIIRGVVAYPDNQLNPSVPLPTCI